MHVKGLEDLMIQSVVIQGAFFGIHNYFITSSMISIHKQYICEVSIQQQHNCGKVSQHKNKRAMKALYRSTG